MRTAPLLALAVRLLVCLVGASVHVGAARTTDAVLLGEVDIALQDGALDVSTEEPFPGKCIVDGKGYAHSQTIPSADPSSHCLCVAGEVYCWWQRYRPSTAPPPSTISPTTAVEQESYTPLGGSTEIGDDSDSSVNPVGEAIENTPGGFVEVNSTFSSGAPTAPVTCLVMGREYREGELLPHSTGNCVECSCGSEGRVECSPRDCVALRAEAPVAPEIREAPDFEVFDLSRGLDEIF